MGELTTLGGRKLANELERALGHQLSPSVHMAFASVDRRDFVPRYYHQQGRQWVEQVAGAEVYGNRAYFIHLDERGRPDSSSSQPSLMALMLEALEVRPGDHLLEIGTGSGYNAALLGNLVRDSGHVVTVEKTSALVAAATERLSHMPWVTPVVADGLLGYPDAAPYQRIIATGASTHIPYEWVEQLTVGGVLIGNLALSLGTSTPVYRLVKDQQGEARGSLLPYPAFFMGLSKADDASSGIPNFAEYEAMPICEHAWATLDMPQLLKDPGLACWINNSIPGLQGHIRADMPGAMTVHHCYLLPGRAMLTCVPSKSAPIGFEMEVHGQEPLWTLLLVAFNEWEKCGRPGIERYHLLVNREGSLNLVLR